MNMQRLSNRECAAPVVRKEEFSNRNGTLWSTWYGDSSSARYCVFSYGPHFPIYVWVQRNAKWYGNSSKYSSTTSRHQNICHPSSNITWLDNEHMIILANGGYQALGKMRVLG